MAKAPRRRGAGGQGRGRKPLPARPAKPEAAKPPAAQPIKPPAAKPVAPPAAQPVQPPAAKPVQPPAAKPVKPAPVAPVAPVARVAAPAAKPVATPASPPAAKPVERPGPPKAEPRGAPRGPRKRMAEEELGHRRGRAPARGDHGGAGMGVGAKVALLAALMAFIAIGVTVFLAGGKGGADEEENFNAFGMNAAMILAAPDAKWYRTAGGGGRSLKHYERMFRDLMGKKGEQFWEERVGELQGDMPRELEGTFRAEDWKKDKRRFEKTMKKLEGGGSSLADPVRARLGPIWNRMSSSERSRYAVKAAWLRSVKGTDEGEWLAGNISASEAVYSWDDLMPLGSIFAYVDGTVEGVAMRIFTADLAGTKSIDPMTAYVAVYDRGTGGGGGMAIGIIMLIVGPLLVGFVAFAIANAHTKHVRGLAREIDRLGSSGHPERQLHAHGSEATAIARSVERMVSNLEFRQKHDGADLEDVVSREQQIAQEIHGTLINKNPPRLDDYEVETLFKPGFEIGGDHFEYFRIDETHLGIILLDTNVRGIPAALVQSAAKSYVRSEAPGVLSPAELLKKVNRHLAGELPAGRHVTALYVVLNTADGSARLASAGHLPLLVYRHQAGKMAKVNPEGIAMGLDKGPVFESSLQEGDIPIGVGDRIVLYTDGALRIQDGEGEEFGEGRFYGAVTNEAPKNSQAFVNFVGATIDRFHLDVPQNDDITISTIKRLR